MATYQDLLAAIKHVQTSTGDLGAWTRGLSAHEQELSAIAADPGLVDTVLAKIRANHPSLFDARTGAPVTPDLPGEQQGAAATAMKKAEDDLAHQNSATARLDLLVISAVLNAHTTTRDGADALQALQREIDEAVRTRTDLDTPAGARDFQRYLIGKLRQIGAIVESASLDDGSKAALAGAWTALYESTKLDETTKRDNETAPARPPTPAPADELPPYGTDLGGDAALDPWLPADPAPGAVTVPSAASAPAPIGPQTAMPTMPTVPMMPSLPGGLPAAPAWPRFDDAMNALPTPQRSAYDDLNLEDLLAAEPADDHEQSDEADGSGESEGTAEPEAPPAGSASPEAATVRLPDGDIITAPTPQLANVIREALAGTPLGEAFQHQGIMIPPAGTAVPHPVDPAKLIAGDVGMFTDRQALALDRQRALLNGQIQPVTGVSGPSFLGWLHPPDPATTTPATSPNGAPAPQPTRPASVAGPAR